MIIPESAQDNQSCLWTFSRLIEMTELYAGEVIWTQRDDLDMIIGQALVIYFSPLAYKDIMAMMGNLN